MATVNIKITDNPDGTFDVDVSGDTKLDSIVTDAQGFALMVVCLAMASKQSIRNATLGYIKDVYDISADHLEEI